MLHQRVVLLILLALGLALPAQAGMHLMAGDVTASATGTNAVVMDCCQHDAGGGMAGHGDCAMSLCQASTVASPAGSRQIAQPRSPLPPNPARYHSPPITPDTPPPQSALPA